MKIRKYFKNKRQLNRAMNIYGKYYKLQENVIRETIRTLFENGEKMVIWGGGLKGIAFLNIFDPSNNYINYVIDIDKNKNGKVLLTGHKIVAAGQPNKQDFSTVLVMNNNHETEIAGKLQKEKFHVKLLNIDSIIFGKLSLDETISMYGGTI